MQSAGANYVRYISANFAVILLLIIYMNMLHMLMCCSVRVCVCLCVLVCVVSSQFWSHLSKEILYKTSVIPMQKENSKPPCRNSQGVLRKLFPKQDKQDKQDKQEFKSALSSTVKHPYLMNINKTQTVFLLNFYNIYSWALQHRHDLLL